MTTAELLTKAADLLVEKGWTRETYQDGNGCMCAVGAITVAAGGSFIYDEDDAPEDFTGPNCDTDPIYAAIEAVENVVNGAVSSRASFCVVEWNDEQGRTAGEVIDVIRFAAKQVSS